MIYDRAMRIAHAAILLACVHWLEAAPVSFQKVIRPLLEDRCAMCHSADAKTSGFEVTSVAALLKGGDKAGAAVIPGKPDSSPLIEYLTGKRQPRMPRELPALSAAEIGAIRNWIAEGAKARLRIRNRLKPDLSRIPRNCSIKHFSARMPRTAGAAVIPKLDRRRC
jgi:cytochrome c551/c552